MASRKKLNITPETTKDENIPKKMINSLDSVDDILNSVDSFIEDVYRDLSITPPQRLSLSSNCSRSTMRRSPTRFDSSSSSSTSLTSPLGAIGGTASPNTPDRSVSPTSHRSVSPTSHRNMDADIERINRICDNVDQNLRSIGLFMNNSRDRRTTNCEQNQTPQTDTNFHISTSTPSLPDVVTVSSPLTRAAQETNSRQRGAQLNKPLSVVPVIDLSDSLTQTPVVFRQPNPIYYNDADDDDDVIIVSANTSPVVDLCTPCFEEQLPRRSSIIQSQLRRRRLAESEYEFDIQQNAEEIGPSMARRRRTRNSRESTSPEKTVSRDTSAENHKQNNSSRTDSDHNSPFRCPVCMDSCLQRQPTSTKCGHVFCEQCIKRAIRLTRKCPMCNTKIANTQIFRIYL